MKRTSKFTAAVLGMCLTISMCTSTQTLAVDAKLNLPVEAQSDSKSILETNISQNSQATFDAGTFNEYDYIKTIQTSTTTELQSLGLTCQKADAIVTSFNDSLNQRAALSEEELRGLGYSNAEIKILQNFASGDTLSDAELRAVTGTCTGKFDRESVTTTDAEFSYTWTWDHCPIMTLSDASALTWIVYEADGDTIGVEQTAKSLTVDYYFQGNATSSGSVFAFQADGLEEDTLEFNTINMQFPVYQTMLAQNGIIFDCYAKTGTITVSIEVPDGVNQTINHIFIGGLYGHTTIGIGYPSVSIGEEVSIGFSGNTSIDPVGGRKATIYRSKSTIDYWNE